MEKWNIVTIRSYTSVETIRADGDVLLLETDDPKLGFQ